MDKAKSKRDVSSKTSLKSEVEKAVSNPGDAGTDPRVWVREDGAVCFGDCITVKPGEDGALDLTIEPDSCGEQAGGVILEHLVKTAGKGVRIIVPASDVKRR